MEMTNNPPLHLQIGEVPRYPFVNHEFDVQLFLVDDKGQLRTNLDVSLSVSIQYDDGGNTSCDPSILVVENLSSLKISRNGMVNIRVKLTDVSMNHDNQRFILRFSGSSNQHAISSVVSTPMLSILHRLVIRDLASSPFIWYKDEGGRENSIEMLVSLIDHTKQKVLNRRINLKLSLKYDNGQDCPKQDILKPTADTKLYIDEATGDAIVRFRVEEVSRSHQKQLFRILVAPDALQYPPATDVSPDLSVSIEVRSKRNKKDKPFTEFEEQMEKRPRTDYTDSYTSNTGLEDNNRAGYYSNLNESSLQPAVQHQQQHQQSQQIYNYKTSGGNQSSSAFPGTNAPTLLESDQNISSNHMSSHYPPNGNALSQNDSLLTKPTSNTAVAVTNTPPNLSRAEAAILSTIHWTNMVVNSFPEMQWRCIGYERDITGQTDLSKPLYSIPNPNDLIELMSEEYGRSARNSLEILYEEIINKKLKNSAVKSEANDVDNRHSGSNMFSNSTSSVSIAAKPALIPSKTNDSIAYNNSNANNSSSDNMNNSSSHANNVFAHDRVRGINNMELNFQGLDSDGNDDNMFIPRNRVKRSNTSDFLDDFLDVYGPFI